MAFWQEWAVLPVRHGSGFEEQQGGLIKAMAAELTALQSSA